MRAPVPALDASQEVLDWIAAEKAGKKKTPVMSARKITIKRSAPSSSSPASKKARTGAPEVRHIPAGKGRLFLNFVVCFVGSGQHFCFLCSHRRRNGHPAGVADGRGG